MPTPSRLNWVVFKVVQHCNLNCSYCYVYNRGDSSWRTRPRRVPDAVVEQLARRIDEHCRTHHLDTFNVELHGGEPLLLGVERMRGLLTTLRDRCQSARIVYHLQTNGLLLNEHWLELFDAEGVTFGVSIDGPPDLGDKHRVYHDGRGSTNALADTLRRLGALPSFDRTFGGALCVVSDPTYSPKRILSWLGELGIKRMDFLLPDANYANLPHGWTGPGPFAEFLLNAWDAWLELGDRSPRIRMFEYMLCGLAGESISLDSLGGPLEGLCVVESDGSIGVSDVARICAPLSLDKITIFSHPLDARNAVYDLTRLQVLSPQCRSCTYLSACHGGYLPHRFDGSSFENPSIYLRSLVSRLRPDLPGGLAGGPKRRRQSRRCLIMDINRLIDAYLMPSHADWSSLYTVVAQGGAIGCLQIYSEWAQASGDAALAAVLSNDCVHSLTRAELWSPFFSRPFPLSATTITQQGDNALHLALLLAEKGARTPVSARFTEPTAVLVSGHAFNGVTGFGTGGAGRTIVLETETGRVELEFEDADCDTALDGHGSRIPRLDLLALLNATSLPRSWRALLPIDRCGLEVEGCLQEPLRLLEEASAILCSAEHCHEWVTRMIGWIVPVRSRAGRLLSGSVSSLPGLVYASYDCRPLMLAESLVHEASHQYFYQLNSIAPLYVRDSPWTGWSPFVQRERTVDGLLLGYHAFLNVTCFYLSLARLGLHVEESSRQIRQTNALLDECVGLLKDCPSLTPAGSAFVRRLDEVRDEHRGQLEMSRS